MSRVLLLSAYDASSHRRWREDVVRHFSEYDWTVLTLPPRYFSWRHRGNSLSWAFTNRSVLEEPYDLVVTTSVTDLSALRGFVPALAEIPTLTYFHENQFVYPTREGRFDVHLGIHDLYTALASDRIVFNSPFNRRTFLEGADAMLTKMPDHVPPGLADRLAERSETLPVPLEDVWFENEDSSRGGPLRIVWNHRWEFDKAPERFFAALFDIAAAGASFELLVLGQKFRETPEIFDVARRRLSEQLVRWGRIESREDYRKAIQTCDVVVSTSLHEFQGLSVLEAVGAGCHPLVPDRLAYLDFIPETNRYESFPDSPDREIEVIRSRLESMIADPDAVRRREPPDVSHLRWSRLREAYGELFQRMIRRS